MKLQAVTTDLKLSHKAFLLVAIPVLFQIAFVIQLTSSLSDAEKEVTEEARSKSVIADVHKINLLFMEIATTASQYIGTRNLSIAKRIDVLGAELRSDLAQIKHSRASSKEQQQELGKIEEVITKQAELLSVVRGAMAEGGRELALYRVSDLVNESSYLVDQLQARLDKFVQLEKEKLAGQPETRRQARNKVKTLLVLALLFNVLLALWLTAYFNKSTILRLKQLMVNMQHLSKREALSLPLSGKDEIAEVDEFFHKMASDLNEFDRLKIDFFNMVSHELRTPLSSLTLFFESAQHGLYGTLTPLGIERAQSCERTTNRLVRLISDLLDLEKVSLGEMSANLVPCNLDDAITSSIETVRELSEHRLIDIEYEPVTVAVLADQERLIQVFVNLLSNALKFSPEGSLVQIMVVKHDGRVRVSIIDQGPGIPPSQQQLVFEKYKQLTHPEVCLKAGTGLGLPVCKQIVELHHGTIGITSHPGLGSEFRVDLPFLIEARYLQPRD